MGPLSRRSGLGWRSGRGSVLLAAMGAFIDGWNDRCQPFSFQLKDATRNLNLDLARSPAT